MIAESIIRWMAGLLAYTTLGIVFYGIWRGTRRQAGRSTGQATSWLRSPWFYLVASAIFFGVCYIGWIQLPLVVSPTTHAVLLVAGPLVFFPGMSFVLWSRLTLGKNYFVSTGLGAQLFADHQLVKNGPFAIVRHPMYSGLILAAFGSVLIYMTWTTVILACFAPSLIFRALREEKALAEEFGSQWLDYCLKVPAFFPYLRKRR